jgi:hypothetical protein
VLKTHPVVALLIPFAGWIPVNERLVILALANLAVDRDDSQLPMLSRYIRHHFPLARRTPAARLAFTTSIATHPVCKTANVTNHQGDCSPHKTPMPHAVNGTEQRAKMSMLVI